MGDEEKESSQARSAPPLGSPADGCRGSEQDDAQMDVDKQEEAARAPETHNTPSTRIPVYISSAPEDPLREETKRRRVSDKNGKKEEED